jgi:TPP-dependent pyruvate/acetoin dehydrogenase alpha subunit
MYRKMATIQRFDQRVVEAFHAVNLPGVVHAYLGTEAPSAVRPASSYGHAAPAR